LKHKGLFFLYIIGDVLGAMAVWIFLFYYRKTLFYVPYSITFQEFKNDDTFLYSLVVIPVFWLILFFYSGFYENVYLKSRLKEIVKTMMISLFGVSVLAFFLFLDDKYSMQDLFRVVMLYFLMQFAVITLFRVFLISLGKFQMRNGKAIVNSIIVFDVFDRTIFNNIAKNLPIGHQLVGYVNHNNEDRGLELPFLGYFENLSDLVSKHSIDDVIIQSSNKEFFIESINKLATNEVSIKAIADIPDILSRSFKFNKVEGPIFHEIYPDLMPLWEKNIKRTLDYGISLIAVIILLPFYLIVMLVLKISNGGNIFYTQERIGKNGKPFRIIKFRTMRSDAELDKPLLSSENDPRITKVGKFLRKWRLDEFPQFFNILKGDMSLVGYRAERQYFIEQIMKEAPYYQHLYRARPGITSLGMVKYGYAENVAQMIDRLKFDIIYIENMSLIFDIKIMIHTVLIMLKGKGR
jgi:exopolysaccharide biosynthesis polyprenyl glycosylphosphotransferase